MNILNLPLSLFDIFLHKLYDNTIKNMKDAKYDK